MVMGEGGESGEGGEEDLLIGDILKHFKDHAQANGMARGPLADEVGQLHLHRPLWLPCALANARSAVRTEPLGYDVPVEAHAAHPRLDQRRMV